MSGFFASLSVCFILKAYDWKLQYLTDYGVPEHVVIILCISELVLKVSVGKFGFKIQIIYEMFISCF